MMDKVIKHILKSQNTTKMLVVRQVQLQKLVDEHGLTNVALATDLKESSLKQYLREKKPRISQAVIAQAEYVFQHNSYKQALLEDKA